MKRFVIVVLILFLILGLYVKEGKVSIFKETIKEFQVKESFEKTDDSIFGLFKDNICQWREGKIEIKKIGQTEVLKLGLNIEKPLIEFGKNYIYFANPLGGQIYFVNEKAELVERIETGRSIFNIKEVGDNLIYHIKEETNECIGIINKKGEKVMSYEFPNETILTYDLDKSGEKLVVSKLEMEDESLKSCVEEYVSGDKKDNLYFQNEIIIDINILNNNDMILLTDSNLYKVADKEVLWNKDFNLIKDIDIGGNNLYVLYSNYLEVLDLNGETVEKLDFKEDYTNVKIKNSGIVAKDILLSGDNRFTLIKSNKDIVTKKQVVYQLDFYEDYYFVLDNESYKQYEVITKELEVKGDK